ncbi:hypothetical protein [Cellvibrio sp. pealriver]|uniref:hypothetical protein n=1 Tax=Cellvibrio sp. pealriver TaxID=1622269 RepID=UPI00066FC05A|nr:hypothetical protein [Cellvibrio sp. pealriver]
MRNTNTTKLVFPGLLLAALISQTFCAHAAERNVKFELETGTEYDSNLAVVELDQYSAASDWAIVANARIHGQWKPTTKASLKGGVSYNSKTWQDLSSYDLAIPQFFIDGNYDFSWATLGASYHHANAKLDGTDFLTLQQSSVYVSRLFNKRVYLRGAVNYQEKDFPAFAERNAHNLALGGDMFIFFNNAKTFVALGINRDDEEAIADHFGYNGTTLKTSINHRFSLWDKENKIQLGARYEDRDYAAVNPELDAVRTDTRKIANIEWQIETTEWLTLATKLERGDYQSNLEIADYSETLASITLKARF